MSYRLNPQVIDKIRANKGLTSDEQVAREVGLTLGTICGIRRGKNPSFKTVIKLMEAADVTDIRAAIVKTPNSLEPVA